jgi:membrane protein YqaA with SNARE-associated domain
MHAFLADYGYAALFFLSFLASSLIPLGSEWLLVTMVLQRHDPFASVAVATIGNYLGACTTYAIGLRGGPYLIRRLLRIDDATRGRAEHLYRRYGAWSLLFSWLPLIGDPLCLVGGVLRTGFGRFSLLVAGGKAGRYALVAWATLEGGRLVSR